MKNLGMLLGATTFTALQIGVLGVAGYADDNSGDIGGPATTLKSNQGSSKATLKNDQRFANPSGYAATFSTNGDIDLTGPFFQALGTNGRACSSCHQPSDGWSVIPVNLQKRFDDTAGTDPVFRTVDGSNSPTADVSSVAARRSAYSMLLTKGLFRVGLPIPAGAEFVLEAVDDPYGFASTAQLSLFRRPLPSTNIKFLSTVMWDTRETFKNASSPICLKPPVGTACFEPIEFDCADQANGAVTGHAEGSPISEALRQQIVDFEYSLFTAQVWDDAAKDLDARGAMGGSVPIVEALTYFGINDNFGDYRTAVPFSPVVFDLYDAWDNLPGKGTEAARASVARGQALFNSKQFTISGVGGLNMSFGLPASFSGTCSTCHNTPNGGNHSIPAPLNLGITDASRRTPDLPLYTLRNLATAETVQTTDPGRALVTGKWADIGRFKGPTLRAVAARAPYFHNGMAKDLAAVVEFYQTRFSIGLSDAEKADLIAFLGAL